MGQIEVLIVIAIILAVVYRLTNAGGPARVAEAPASPRLPIADVVQAQPPSVSRTYHGTTDAIHRARAADAESLAAAGYYPASESFIPGNYSGATWLLAALLIFLLVGILLLIYMLGHKPDGYLTVIYERRDAVATIAPAAAQDPNADIRSALAHLDSLRADGVVTEGEYAAKRADILSRL